MHPKSRDRSGNAKLLADVRRAQRLPPAQGGASTRNSKMGRRLAALRERRE